MHVAARTECQAYGIEIQSNVAHLAQAYANEFKSRMRFFNRRMGTLQLLEGDFLTHPSIPKVLAKAKVIFVNNYVFSPELNRSLLDLFLDVNEGTMIVSLKAFAPPDLRISSRNIHSLEVLFDVKVVDFPGSLFPSLSETSSFFTSLSDTVYGEINPNLVEQILTQVTLNPEDVFIDLGSGIGNVVMHVAARTECQAYGIEIQSNVAHLAQAYANEFKSRMRFFNRRMGTLQLLEGDFLTHPSIPKVLAKAKVIFVNNYVFSPELNRSLLDLFLDVNEGTMIVSLKAFAPPDLRISSRNIHSLEVLFDVKVVEFGTGSVSWTDQGGKFYIHTMNRQRVQKFAEQIGGKNFY
ncbi:Nucleosomal histone H3-Lys79 methylase [Coelomomyces lativittatus]|nr:Nucleosomal histone H3-Lys79 methylase [Coelomomyces lativittatus]